MQDDVISGERCIGDILRKRNTFRDITGCLIDHIQGSGGVIDQKDVLSVLHQVHLAGVGGEHGVEFENLRIGPANSLLVSVGHPHSTVVEVDPLCLVTSCDQ